MATYDDATLYQQMENENNPYGQNLPPTPMTEVEIDETQPQPRRSAGATVGAAIAAGVGGVLLGTAAGGGVAYAMTANDPGEPDTEDDNNVEVDTDANTSISGQMVCDDSLSFSQAFAQARATLGAGGVFYWHGGVYGTYYATEWNAMTPAEQHEFTAMAMGQAPPATAPAPTTVVHHEVVHHHVVVEDQPADWDDQTERERAEFDDNDGRQRVAIDNDNDGFDTGGRASSTGGYDGPSDDDTNDYNPELNVEYEGPDTADLGDDNLHLTSADVDDYNGMSDYINDVQEA